MSTITSDLISPLFDEPMTLVAGLATLASVWFLFSPKQEPSTNTLPGKEDKAPPPPFVPYYIPGVGSALEIARMGLEPFIRQNAQRLGNAPIITALMAGKRMHFIADSAVFGAPFRYPEKQLSMGPVIGDFVHSFFGTSRKGLETALAKREGLAPLQDHLLKAKGLANMTALVQTSIHTHVQELTTKNKSTTSSSGDGSLLTMDLMKFVNQIMFRTVLDVLISPDLSHDEFLTTYDTFESAMMIAFLNLPMKLLAPASFKARTKLVQWMSDPTATWRPYMQERRDFLSKHGDMSMDDLAKDNILWTWGSVSNFVPSNFWFLYQVANTPAALEAIRAEVDAVLDKEESLSVSDLDNMKALDSAFQEVLRLHNRFMISRQALQDMELDFKNGQKYFVKEGEQVIMFTPILHHDPALYPNPSEYQWDRFLKQPTSGRPDMRSFGGGAHYCPGRKFATNGAKAMVAHMVHKYDLVLDGTATPDMSRDGLGMLHSKTPVQVTLKPRRR